jgi:HK97 gp10 family phage protein
MTRRTSITSGFRELERALAEDLPKATARSVLTRTAKNAMERIRTGMEQRAPKATGKLAGEMKTQPVKAKRETRTRFARQNGVSVNTGPVGREEGGNAAWQEFGTENMSPHPFARPTADAEGLNVLGEVKDELTKQIDAAKKRIARKAARARR